MLMYTILWLNKFIPNGTDTLLPTVTTLQRCRHGISEKIGTNSGGNNTLIYIILPLYNF